MSRGMIDGVFAEGRNIPTKPRFRSVPDVAVLNSPFRFLRNSSLSTDVFQGASFGIVSSLGCFLV